MIKLDKQLQIWLKVDFLTLRPCTYLRLSDGGLYFALFSADKQNTSVSERTLSNNTTIWKCEYERSFRSYFFVDNCTCTASDDVATAYLVRITHERVQCVCQRAIRRMETPATTRRESPTSEVRRRLYEWSPEHLTLRAVELIMSRLT